MRGTPIQVSAVRAGRRLSPGPGSRTPHVGAGLVGMSHSQSKGTPLGIVAGDINCACFVWCRWCMRARPARNSFSLPGCIQHDGWSPARCSIQDSIKCTYNVCKHAATTCMRVAHINYSMSIKCTYNVCEHAETTCMRVAHINYSMSQHVRLATDI